MTTVPQNLKTPRAPNNEKMDDSIMPKSQRLQSSECLNSLIIIIND